LKITKKTSKQIAAVLASVQDETGDAPGWEFNMTVFQLGEYLKHNHGIDSVEFEKSCHVNSTPDHEAYPWLEWDEETKDIERSN